MPRCPSCGDRIKGAFIEERAASDIIAQRDLLKSQKARLENKVERQATWIEKLERVRGQMAKEIRFLRDELEKATGRTWFDKAGRA